MLNRHLLRIKAFQLRFAWEQMRQGIAEAGRIAIASSFVPDPLSDEPFDPIRAEGDKLMALSLYEDAILNGISPKRSPEAGLASGDSIEAAEGAHSTYLDRIATTKKSHLMDNLQGIYQLEQYYVMLLQLLVYVADRVQEDEEDKPNRLIKVAPALPHELKLAKHPFIVALRDYDRYKAAVIRLGFEWRNSEEDLAKVVYQDLQQWPAYLEYKQKQRTNEEEDNKFIQAMVRVFFQQHDALQAWFSERVTAWPTDLNVVKSMLLRTIKSFYEPEGISLATVSLDWDDDKGFLMTLYDQSLLLEQQALTMLEQVASNWDPSRMALADRVLLQLGYTEFVSMPSVPKKVTIAEYVDIAKEFSTPESSDFVNAILDKMAQQLEQAGAMKKSGRGLVQG